MSFKNTGGEREWIFNPALELGEGQLFPNLAKELFPNLMDADMQLTTEIITRLLDEPGTEDPEAGYDGVSFTQTENDDEFLDWIEWDNLAA